MIPKAISTCLALSMTILSGTATNADHGPTAWWRFDELTGGTALDSAGQIRDRIDGHFRPIDGVSGSGIRFDGFTTVVRRAAAHAPRLTDEFTIDAWVALQAYPWNRCPLVAQHQGTSRGYFFGIDAEGHIGFQAAVNGEWSSHWTKTRIPVMEWTHVAVTFQKDAHISIYVNAVLVERAAIRGALEPASGIDLQIGRNHKKTPAANLVRPDTAIPASYSLDGIIDEVRIHRRALSDPEIKQGYEQNKPTGAPALQQGKLPSGPAGAGRFGAYYYHLKFAQEWDALWRGSGPDVIVRFDIAPIRLVCWRGVSYVPCWVTENGNWFSNEFMERSGSKSGLKGCCESMSDKQARYSHVKIIENSDARAVVYWRYSPVDVLYRQPYQDEQTGWGDWAEEYYTIYPDGVAARKVVMWSSNLKDWHEWCQSLPIMHPGQRPEDVLDTEVMLTLANMAGEHCTIAAPPDSSRAPQTVPDANMQIVHYKSRFKPFLVLMPDKPSIRPWLRPARKESAYSWWNHWPVAQVPSEGRYATAADRAAHSCTSTQDSAAYEITENSITKIMLCGLTDGGIEELVALARSWWQAPKLTVISSGYVSNGYDPSQRAFVLVPEDPDRAGSSILEFELDANHESPVTNPAFVIRNWGEPSAVVTINETEVEPGEDLRLGHHHALEGSHLILFVSLKSTGPLRIKLVPSGG